MFKRNLARGRIACFKGLAEKDSIFPPKTGVEQQSHVTQKNPHRCCWRTILISLISMHFFYSKGVFLRKCDSFLKSSKKRYSKKTILNLKFQITAHNSIILWAGILNFKFRIVFWNIYCLEIWKRNCTFWKKARQMNRFTKNIA